MTSSSPGPTKADGNGIRVLLSHPLILRAAWMRVDGWYRSGNLAPQPELSRWRIHPEGRLRELRKALLKGSWAPGVWPQIPFPKKGARLRHYTLPSVWDQVAFMAYLVLLGPLLDAMEKPFSFGNRWYRPVFWNRRRGTAGVWESLPCPLLSDRVSLPYARSHGLFRRVAHWAAAHMTGTEVVKQDRSGPVPHFEDFSGKSLPPFVKADWWNGKSSNAHPGRGYWATLDIELAFPSVRLGVLHESMIAGLRELDNSKETPTKLTSGYPEDVLSALSRSETREDLAKSLIGMLGKIQIGSGFDRDTWIPSHARPELPPENKGLPTGLAISGLLLNSVLSHADDHVMEHLNGRSPENRGAFLRFADDMVLLSRSKEGLLELIDVVCTGLNSKRPATPATKTLSSNLYLNISKIGPESVNRVLREYLRDAGWKECSEDHCHQLLPSGENRDGLASTLSSWWSTLSDSEKKPLTDAFDRLAIVRAGLGPFVTTMVERMSEIGRDTLTDRFGEGPRNRLDQLHELIRFEIDDQQVRADTRRLFAANRLARAWLSGAMETQRVEIAEIRSSVAHALQQAPWKTAMWRPIVRAAARRPIAGQKGIESYDNLAAQDWLKAQLGRIAAGEGGALHCDSWDVLWPEPPEAKPCNPAGRGDSWRGLYLSYHRAAFWHEVAELLRLLHAHAERMKCGDPWDPGPPPTSWAVRGVPPGCENDVAAWLASFDTWLDVLYPAGTTPGSWDAPWESDALMEAVLASTPKLDLAKAFLKSGIQEKNGKTEGNLMVPGSIERLRKSKKLRTILRKRRWLMPQNTPGNRESVELQMVALSHIAMGSGKEGLGEYLFGKNAEPRIISATVESQRALAVIANSLGISRFVPKAQIVGAVPAPEVLERDVRSDPFILWEYHAARSIDLGHPRAAHQGPPTLHRLLWGNLSSEDLAHWSISPWEAPSLGLPVTVALGFLAEIIASEPPKKTSRVVGIPQTWKLIGETAPLVAGRRLQFGRISDETVSGKVRVGRDVAWEIPPHAGYFLPVLVAPRKTGTVSYRLYCDTLMLLTACDGDERILDALVRSGPGSIPFEDRWNWRSRIHFSPEIWRLLEKTVRLQQDEGLVESLRTELKQYAENVPSPRDFVDIRVDIRLDGEDDLEIVRTIRQGQTPEELPKELRINQVDLSKELVVRIGQISQRLLSDQKVFTQRFPKSEAADVNAVMAQVSAALQLPRYGFHEKGGPEIVILPELSIPQTEVGTLRDHAKKHRRAYLAGLMWRLLPMAAKPAAGSPVSGYWLVNEAELAIPVGAGNRGPVTLRPFRIRKPRPAHLEYGFARALTATRHGTWSILPGTHWYRFVHNRWGDFSIAICSDILDSAPWRSLQGEILHLFMCAFNKDVDLFDGLTWIRAYEGAMNVVSVNHGFYGGSFLWTPKHDHARELARLRGNHLNLIADVTLPVQALLENQNDGVFRAVSAECCRWLGHNRKRGEFKAPPPGFSRRKETLK